MNGSKIFTPVTTDSFQEAEMARNFSTGIIKMNGDLDMKHGKKRISIKVAPVITPLNADSRVSDRVSEEF